MKPKNMKNTLTKIFAAILFFAIASAPLRAQTNAADATATATADAPPTSAVSTAVSANSEPASTPQNHFQRRSLWNERVRDLVPLAWIFVSFAIPVAIIAICAYSRHRRHTLANETLRAMIDKGLPITPELVDSLKSKQPTPKTGGQSHKDIRTGLILIGIGIGVEMLCGRPGWIVLFIGVAFLLIGLLKIGTGDNC